MKEIYLTFDDGPTPEVTDRVLNILEDFSAKATFFCIGGNVQSQPYLYRCILEKGHSVGNHTWNHMSGWAFSDFAYYRNIAECAKMVESNLFRPPYGRISPSQINVLKTRYTIVMWDVLAADWSADVSPHQCFSNVRDSVTNGSIVVFHDSLKGKKNMLYALPKTLDYFSQQGFVFKSLNMGQTISTASLENVSL